MVLLGINIDHIATIRQARGGNEPDPTEAALLVQSCGADGITCHLREDRRHIQDKDVYSIKNAINIPLNLEMACVDDIIKIAIDLKPKTCTIVPEKRMEITTEGGLNVIDNFSKISSAVNILHCSGIDVSLFIEPDIKQIDASKNVCADYIEIHTGKYANTEGDEKLSELTSIKNAVQYALSLGLKVNAGHGLNYNNTYEIASIKGIHELNIGHSIISRAVFSGLPKAAEEMKKIIYNASK